MPPKTQKTVAYRRKKLAVRRPVEDSPPSPAAPERKRRVATTPEARVRKLQKEGLLPQPVTEVTPVPVHVTSSSSLPSDPMAFTSSSTNSDSTPNEENIFDKLEQAVEQATELAELEQRREAFWEARTKHRNEQPARDQPESDHREEVFKRHEDLWERFVKKKNELQALAQQATAAHEEQPQGIHVVGVESSEQGRAQDEDPVPSVPSQPEQTGVPHEEFREQVPTPPTNQKLLNPSQSKVRPGLNPLKKRILRMKGKSPQPPGQPPRRRKASQLPQEEELEISL